jgi:hypothetical protein
MTFETGVSGELLKTEKSVQGRGRIGSVLLAQHVRQFKANQEGCEAANRTRYGREIANHFPAEP